MAPLSLGTNGHARIKDADFQTKKDHPPVNDPLAFDDPKSKKARKSAAFKNLLDDLERGGGKKKPSDLPAFPLHALPTVLRTWVEAIGGETQSAPDAAAMIALASSSACLANNVSIIARDGFSEPLNLYVGVLTSRGDRSDAVMRGAVAPLHELEQEKDGDNELLEVSTTTIAEMTEMCEFHNEKESLDMLEKCRVEHDRLSSKPEPARLTSDVTARSIDNKLDEYGRIANFSTRGGIIRQIAGRSSASRERLMELLENCHAGIEGTFTCASLIDSSLVAQFAGQRTCHASPLLSRVLFAVPESRVGKRMIAPPAKSREVESQYFDDMRRLVNRKPGMIGVSPEAESLLREFEAEIESQLGERGVLVPIAQWAEHLRGATLRIAGVLHCWISNEIFVSLESMAAAIEIARYLIPHAACALEKFGAADDDCDEMEHALIRYARIAREFSGRDAWQHLRRSFLKPSVLRSALAMLVHRGYLRDVDGSGRRFAVVSRAISLGSPSDPRVPPSTETVAAPHVTSREKTPPRESAESTQPSVGVPPLGGLKAG